MKKIALLRELEKYPVFTLETVMRILKKERNYIKLVIHRLKKEGLIFKIEKNKYTLHKDPILVASNIVWPSYLGFWSALRHHNLTEQLPQKISVITTRSRKNYQIEFAGTEIFFTKVNPGYFFGFKKEIYNDFIIFVSDPEKTLIDSALFKRISFMEISEIIKENFDDINAERIIQYALKTKSNALVKRFGFLFDNLGKDFFYIIGNAIGNLSSNYVLLDYSMPEEGKNTDNTDNSKNKNKNKKWRIIENVKL